MKTIQEDTSLAAGPARSDSGSLIRGLALLEVLQSAQRPLTATELAEATQQPLSTVHRLVQVLISREYVYKDESRRYFAGPRTLAPLHLYHPLNVLRREAQPYLRSIREQFRQTSSILVFLGIERLVLELAVENDSLSPYHATHLKSPLHGAASGKVLLASLSPGQLAAAVGPGPLVKRTPNAIGDTAALAVELELVRRQGFAVAIDESHVGLNATAAPIIAPGGHVIGCFIISGLSSDFSAERVHAAGPVIKATADLFSTGSSGVRLVSTLVGYDPVDGSSARYSF